jgi:DNA segregation ATPase FtsK/SpoIIIE, S-DNA-T family
VSWALDLERDGGLLVYGTSGSGKTTLLRTLAASLAQSAPPGEVQIYALDFASRGLHGLDALPHCGSVIAGEESERVLRLLDGLHRDVRARSAALGDVGASGLADYRRRAGQPLPRIVLLLDGYPAFAANYERVAFGDPLNALHRLAAEGRAVGIHVVVTADRRAGVPGALAGVVPGRVVLRLADEDDYPALGVPKALVAGTELPPGRGFTRDGAEVQIAVFGEDPSEQVAALAALGRRLTDAYPGQEAPRIGVLPSRVPCDRLPAPPADLVAVVGVGNDRLQPVVADLREDHFLVAGPVRSGRSTALGTIVTSLRRARPDLDAHLLAPRRSALPAAGSWTSVAEGPDACRVRADELLRLLERPAGAPVVLVVVDDGGELSELMALETIVRRGRDGGVRLLAAVETHAAARAFGGWLREIRSVRRGLLLAPDPETDGDLLGVRLPRSSPVPPAPGRGYLVGAGAAELIQTGTA